MQRVERAYLLQRQAFKETDARLKLLCEHSGVVSGILHGVYSDNIKHRASRAALQPSCLLEVSFTQKPGLANIHFVEAVTPIAKLSPKALVLIGYLQELLFHFLPEDAEASFIFMAYQNAWLSCINQSENLETMLREFEWQLLDSVGFSFDWLSCQQTGNMVKPHKNYQFICHASQQGFLETNKAGIEGSDILAMAEGDFSLHSTQRAAKAVFRQLIEAQLGGKKLRSKAMYRQLFAAK